MDKREYYELADYDFKCLRKNLDGRKMRYNRNSEREYVTNVLNELFNNIKLHEPQIDSYYDFWKQWKENKKNILDPDDSNGTNTYMRVVYYLLWGKLLCLGKEIANKGIYNNGWRNFRISCIFGSKIPWGSETIYSLATFEKYLVTKKNPTIEDYCKKMHQLGNFLIVPAYFNQLKGLIKKENFFEGLLELKKDYMYQDRLQVRDSTASSREEKEIIIKKRFNEWTEQDFNKYINFCFLWDYVDIDPVNKDYIIKGQQEKYCIDTMEDFNRYVDDAVKYIPRRGIFMAAMLEIANEFYQDDDNDIFIDWKNWKVSIYYKIIMKEVFLKDSTIYSGYDCVLKDIIEVLEKASEQLLFAEERKGEISKILDILCDAKKKIAAIK